MTTRLFFLLSLLLLVPAGVLAQRSSIEPGKPIERALAPNEVATYNLRLAAGQYARLEADQRGLDVALCVFDPAGKEIVEADFFRTGEPEQLYVVAETAGVYRVEVRRSGQNTNNGRYELRVKDLRTATEQDSASFAAEKLVAEASRIEQQQTADARKQAIEKYQQSLPFWETAKDVVWQVRTLCLISTNYIILGDKQNALDFSNRALPPAEIAANRPDDEQRREGIQAKAYALDTAGRFQQELGDRKKALSIYNESIALSRSISDRVGELNTTINMARTSQYVGDYPKALEYAETAQQMVQQLGDRRKEATVLNNICLTYQSTGKYDLSLDNCNRAVMLARDTNDRVVEANSLNNTGNVYYSTGDYQKAIDFYSQANDKYKQLGNLRGQGMTFNNIGWLYATLGDHQKSVDLYTRALEIFRAQKDKQREAAVLNNIGVDYSNMSEYGKALEIHLQVLALRDPATNRDGTAITLENIAECYAHLKERQKALDYYQKVLTLIGADGDPRLIATTLTHVGTLYRDMGDFQHAGASYNDALQLAVRVGDRYTEAATLGQMAKFERDRGNLVEARKLIERSLTVCESLRTSVKSSQLRASFLGSTSEYYEVAVDVLMRLHEQHPADGYDAEALAASERSRARSLLELLAESRAEIREGVDATLLDREVKLRDTIADKAEAQVRLLSGKHTDEAANKAAKELDALTTEYEQVLGEIREKSPRYAALLQPSPLKLKEIQSVLDDETVLLEYSLGEQQSFLFAVTPGTIRTFKLPARKEIETIAHRLYEVVSERNRAATGETLAQQQARVAQSDAEFQKIAIELSRMLLEPAAAELKNKRLVFVGDGVLQYVPFSALAGAAASGAYRPLVLDHEVVNLPSASVMAVLRRENSGRERAPKILAVLADPVFQSDDPRIGSVKAAHTKAKADEAPSGEVYRSAKESGLDGFVRLRFTRREAEEITRLVTPDKRYEALDFDASRAHATSAELGQYRIVHFATHGLVNNRHPELSGIVLSLVDENGKAQNGFLRLYEIYNLKLGADLVVLSACQTAVGQEIEGEGLLGLTRGFMYAGAPRVVATLWQVDDRATAELMKRFYQKMLGEGLRPAAALQAAQVAMQSDSRWRSPHYWAGFTLQGEWK